MAVNFPDNPTNGDTTVVNGVTYTYNATNNLWKAGSSSSSGGSGGTTTYATAAELPQTATNGDLALVEETDKLYIWNDTAWYNIALINTAPSITQGGAGSYTLATDGTPTVITLTATDPESVPVTWSYAVTSGSLTNGGGVTATVTQADNVFTITPTTTEAYAGTFTLTFSVTDGANIVNDVNSFSLVFVTLVQNSKYTSALITTDGTTGNNTTFTDSSSNALTITTAGAPLSQSFSPYRSGGYSVEIDASAGSWIQAQSHSDFAFGTGDFTVEFWMKSQKSDQWLLLIDQQYQAQGVSIWINPTNELVYYPNSSTPALTSQALTMSDWIHVALVRNSGTTKFYVNGVWNSTSYSDSQNFPTNLPLKMGSDYSAASYGYKGYFRDVRVTNTAVYSTNFTPPTEPLTEIAGTRLLTCQSLTFKDESTTPHTIGITGTPSIVPVGPYDYDEYNPSNHGGSVYFDGSGDYLRATSSVLAEGTDDFTLECWFYIPTSFSPAQNDTLFGHDTTPGYQISWNSGGFTFMGDTSVRVLNTTNVTTDIKGAWHHIAYCRSGNTLYGFLDGQSLGTSTNSVVSTNFTNTTIDVGVNRGGTGYFQGWISDVRIVKGTAVYTSSFTPPTEPLSSSGAALHVVGTDANIIDKSQSSNNITLVNNTTASTTQTKYSSSSIYFDGTGDFISIPYSDKFAIGTSDYTVEAWVYQISPGEIVGAFNLASNFAGWLFSTSFGSVPNKLAVFNSDGTNTESKESNGTISNNQWHHIAFVKLGTTLNFYIDGTLDSSHVLTVTSTGSQQNIHIGADSNSLTTPSRNYQGYIEDLRITKGLARYTANFTPPTGSLEG